jgi:hypothetical protein
VGESYRRIDNYTKRAYQCPCIDRPEVMMEAGDEGDEDMENANCVQSLFVRVEEFGLSQLLKSIIVRQSSITREGE